MPESTGAALTGLAGMVGQEKVARSLEYLQGEVRPAAHADLARMGFAGSRCLGGLAGERSRVGRTLSGESIPLW